MSQNFIQVFAPKTIKDMVLPDRIKNELLIPMYKHLLFYGPPGLGKSLAASIISNEYVYKYVNVSVDGKIDTLRNELTEFCETAQFSFNKKDDVKIIFFDEMDGASAAFYDGLRGFMDMYQEKVKFICTLNHFSKIPATLKSRFTCINFASISSEEEQEAKANYTKRMNGIMAACKMTCTDGSFDKELEKVFPDYRKPLEILERLFRSKTTVINSENLFAAKFEFIELYELILSKADSIQFHKMLMGEYATKAIEVLTSIHEGMVDYIISKRPDAVGIVPYVIIETAVHMDMSTRIDPALAMKACCHKLALYASQHIKK